MIGLHTNVQYKQNTKFVDNANVYEVLSSLDLFWLYNEEKYRGKFLTTIKIIGTINKQQTTGEQHDDETNAQDYQWIWNT